MQDLLLSVNSSQHQEFATLTMHPNQLDLTTDQLNQMSRKGTYALIFTKSSLSEQGTHCKWGLRLCSSECPWKGDRRVGFETHSQMVPAAARTEAWLKSSQQSLTSTYCHPYPSSQRPVGWIINSLWGGFTLELVFLVSTHIGLMIQSWLMCSLDLSFLPSPDGGWRFNLQILNVLNWEGLFSR